MEIDILINQLDEHNEGNILMTEKYRPKEVWFIVDKYEIDEMESIREYYKEKFQNIALKEYVIKDSKLDELSNIATNLNGKKAVVNLTGGPRVNSLMLLKLCNNYNIPSIYVDIKEKIIYSFNEKIQLNTEELASLNIDDILKASGGTMVEDSTDLCNKEDLIYLSKQIYNNLDIWHKYKQRLYEASIFQHDEYDNRKIYLNLENLLEEEKILVKRILEKLKDINGLQYKIDNKKITIEFLNEYLKTFIFKSGTWLEIATNNIIKSIEEVDESKNGVIFLWNNENKSVRNEIDVVAIKESIPICISCKDSDKYNEVALNELNVYADRIGGDNVYKILVATKEPEKKPVRTRAEEMGIHIVIFDGDESKFISNIKEIIKE